MKCCPLLKPLCVCGRTIRSESARFSRTPELCGVCAGGWS